MVYGRKPFSRHGFESWSQYCYEHFNYVSCSFLFICTSWVWGMIHTNAKAKATSAHLADKRIRKTGPMITFREKLQRAVREAKHESKTKNVGGFKTKPLSLSGSDVTLDPTIWRKLSEGSNTAQQNVRSHIGVVPTSQVPGKRPKTNTRKPNTCAFPVSSMTSLLGWRVLVALSNRNVFSTVTADIPSKCSLSSTDAR